MSDCRIIGDICPGCLLKPCECPLDDSALRALFAGSDDAA